MRWQFVTGAAPTVVAQAPPNLGTGLSLSRNLTAATFAEAVVGLDTGRLVLKKSGATPLPGAAGWSSATKRVRFNPTAYLLRYAGYT